MKLIFDFDDVLFNNTKQFKEHMYMCLEKAGVSRTAAKEYYKEVREKEFSLKNFISTLLIHGKIDKKMESIYEEIMRECPNFINVELIEIVKKLGKNNCYIITNGEYEFNKDKVFGSGIASLFSNVYIVPGSKREIIYDICNRNKDKKVIFIEDKIKFIEDIDTTEYPNLKTILFDEQGLEKLLAILPQS